MSHHSHFRPSPKFAAIALLAAACMLGGCGRKGPLDLPPNAAMQPGPLDVDSGEVPANQGYGTGDAAGAATAQGNVFGSGSGRRGTVITAPPGQKKRIILDPILD